MADKTRKPSSKEQQYLTPVERMYKDCQIGQIMPDGRRFIGIEKLRSGEAVAMFESADRAPETIRRNRKNLEIAFNQLQASLGDDVYRPLIFPPRVGVDC